MAGETHLLGHCSVRHLPLQGSINSLVKIICLHQNFFAMEETSQKIGQATGQAQGCVSPPCQSAHTCACSATAGCNF